MKRLLVAASFAFLLLSSTAALADKHHGHGGHGHHRDWDDDDDDDDRVVLVRHDNGRHRGWHRGERIPVVYLEQPRYYVEDYRVYDLERPRPGYRWVRDDEGRFILVAIATGVIADILLHH